MKKRVFLTLVLPLILVGCGGENTSQSSDNISSEEQISESSSFSSEKKDSYSVEVLYPDNTPVKGGVKVEWCNEASCSKSVEVNDNGLAFNDELKDDEYTVHINNIPEGYAYNPDYYVVNAENKSITITLSEILPYQEGDGSKYQEGENKGPYVVKEGVYNVSLTENNNYHYYAFTPTTPGKFVIESWSLSDDPSLDYYSNTMQVIPDDPYETYDNNGTSNNFKYEFEISSNDYGYENSGYTMVFGVTFKNTARSVEFPISFKCIEKYDYKTNNKVENEIETKVASNVPNVYKKPAEDKLTPAKYDGSTPVYFNEEDGLYHVDSKNGNYLFAYITKTNANISESFAEAQKSMSKALIINNVDYNSFIDSYKNVVNSDGVCLVTQELKEFIDIYVKLGPGEFQLSFNGDTYNENSWLIYCGYYQTVYTDLKKSSITPKFSSLKYGDFIGAYNVNISKINEIVIDYNASSLNTYTIISDDPNIVISYNDINYEADVNLVIKSNNDENISFKVNSKDASNSVVKFKLYYGNKNIKLADVGSNTIKVNDNKEEVLFIASNKASYAFSAKKGSSVSFVINGITYSSLDEDIYVELKLESNESFVFELISINPNVDTLIFKITEIGDLQIGENILDFSGESLLEGFELNLDIEESGNYLFSINSSYYNLISIKINGTKYSFSSDGIISNFYFDANTSIHLSVESKSLVDHFINLNIIKVDGNLTKGDNTLNLTSNKSCFIFEVPSDGVYTFSSSSISGDVGVYFEYQGDSYGPASSTNKTVSFDTTNLTKGQLVVIYVGYTSLDSSTVLPTSFEVILNINSK